MGTWKHIRAVLLLPFVVTVVIPGVILWLTGPDTLGLWQSADATRQAASWPCGTGTPVSC